MASLAFPSSVISVGGNLINLTQSERLGVSLPTWINHLLIISCSVWTDSPPAELSARAAAVTGASCDEWPSLEHRRNNSVESRPAPASGLLSSWSLVRLSFTPVQAGGYKLHSKTINAFIASVKFDC